MCVCVCAYVKCSPSIIIFDCTVSNAITHFAQNINSSHSFPSFEFAFMQEHTTLQLLQPYQSCNSAECDPNETSVIFIVFLFKPFTTAFIYFFFIQFKLVTSRIKPYNSRFVFLVVCYFCLLRHIISLLQFLLPSSCALFLILTLEFILRICVYVCVV